jgi:hypothetical protein
VLVPVPVLIVLWTRARSEFGAALLQNEGADRSRNFSFAFPLMTR